MNEEKQIEEMARVLCGMASSCDKCMFKKTNCYEYQEAKAIYEADFKKQEWISVEERMPDVLQEVFVYRGKHIGNLMNIYTYVGGDMWQDEYGFGCRQEDEGITHWMPLPEPPKMKGE